MDLLWLGKRYCLICDQESYKILKISTNIVTFHVCHVAEENGKLSYKPLLTDKNIITEDFLGNILYLFCICLSRLRLFTVPYFSVGFSRVERFD